MSTRAKFTRDAPDTRRMALIEATALTLARRGAAGTSVRAICAEAGVSPGLIRHYYPGVEALIAATYAHVGERIAGALDDAMAEAGTEPRARLAAYVLASFRPPVTDPALLATWLAFWSLVKTDAWMARLHEDIYADYRRTIEELAGECGVPSANRRMVAIAIAALVDGLWLELCLDPTTFSAAEASAIAERWLGSLLEQPEFVGG